MPGTREAVEKRTHVIVRLTADQKTRWHAYCAERGHGYLSVLVRRAVEEFMAAHPNPARGPRLYEDSRL